MDAGELYEKLKKVQEPKGYYFNADHEYVLGLLEALLLNRERYGYMACPCRLAAQDREKDRDIICPCAYRAPDVAEYGTCYCSLYVAEAERERTDWQSIPERRPPELQGF
jgi:ferredoxin-thioredoxin reductase catalytic subunit